MPSAPTPIALAAVPPRRLGPGRVLPAILAATLLLDGGLRLLPLDRFAFEAWGPMTVNARAGAPFEPGKTFERRRGWGDLANAGNYPEDRQYRDEHFTSDQHGFRRSDGVVPGRPVAAVLFGDSMGAGAGVSDHQTISSRLFQLTGRPVYNAAGRPFASVTRIREICDLAGLRGGVVLYQLKEWGGLIAFPRTGVRTNPFAEARQAPANAPRSVSRLGILASRMVRRAEAWLGVRGDQGRISRETLSNGDGMLFMPGIDIPFPERPAGVLDWAYLRDELHRHGHQLLVVLLPGRRTIYGPYLTPPLATEERAARLARVARQLEEGGIPAIDVTPALAAAALDGFPSRRYVYFLDDIHLSPAGNDVVARAVKARLGW